MTPTKKEIERAKSKTQNPRDRGEEAVIIDREREINRDLEKIINI